MPDRTTLLDQNRYAPRGLSNKGRNAVRTFWLAVGICVVLGVAISGCGGSYDEAISKQDFARQGDALCLKINEKAAGEVQKALNHPEFANAKSEGEGIR